MARVVFLGTPSFAVPSLEALVELRQRGEIELAGVVTQPDRPGHRGRVQAPPVKDVAIAAGVPVLQPARLDRAAVEQVLSWRPDALVWAAYGNLVPARLIDAVGGRALNVHPSLLPRWRGAEPVAHAILAGDRETGVTLMEGTAALDAGPIVEQERVAVDAGETAGELEARLAQLGARMIERGLRAYLAGRTLPRPQDEAAVTWAPRLDPALAVLDFARPADELAGIVRAYWPDPGAHTSHRGTRIGVVRASVTGGTPKEHGVVKVEGGVPHVAAGAGWLRLDEVRPAGKRTMSGAEWARGRPELEGSTFPS